MKFPGGRNGFSFFFLSFSLVPIETREQGALRCCSWQLVDFSLFFLHTMGNGMNALQNILRLNDCVCGWLIAAVAVIRREKAWPESAWNGAQRLTCARDRKMFQFFFFAYSQKNQYLFVRNSLIGIIMVCLLSLEGSIWFDCLHIFFAGLLHNVLRIEPFGCFSRRRRQRMRVRVIWSEETFSLGSSLDNTIDWKFI